MSYEFLPMAPLAPAPYLRAQAALMIDIDLSRWAVVGKLYQLNTDAVLLYLFGA